jgi:hypothetical protein
MNAAKRKLILWLHLILSIAIVGFIYGPVANIPEAAQFTRVVAMPTVIISGLWMCEGSRIKKWVRSMAQFSFRNAPRRFGS